VACAKPLKRRLKILPILVTRILGQRCAIVGDGTILVAFMIVEHGAVGVGIAIARIELDGLGVVAERCVDVALLLLGDAAIVVSDRVLPIDGDRRAAILDGEIRLSLLVVGDAAIDQGVGELGVDGDGLAEIGDRLIEVVLIAIDEASRQIKSCLPGIDLDGLIEVGHRTVEIALLLIGTASQTIGQRNVWTFRFEREKFRAPVDLLGHIRILIAVVDRIGVRWTGREDDAGANNVTEHHPHLGYSVAGLTKSSRDRARPEPPSLPPGKGPEEAVDARRAAAHGPAMTVSVKPAPSPVVTVGRARFGNALPLALIAGPCALESRALALEIAEALKAIADRAGIGLVYKTSFDKANRTSARSARGLGLAEALPIFAEIRERTALPVLTDVHEPDQCAAVAEVVDVLQIPAFLCRQTDLLIAAARTGKVVNVKKGQFLAPWDMAHVVAKVVGAGNPQVLVTERGVSFGYNTLVSDMRALPILAETGAPVIFDATHSVQQPGGQGAQSGGERKFVPVLARAAVAAGVAGVFIETHQDPDRAPSDGPNMLPLTALPSLLGELIEIDNLVKRVSHQG
jgi:2-dehydro-3-deoxyphosphooctonate aldolase (KDO 8-P synthase)